MLGKAPTTAPPATDHPFERLCRLRDFLQDGQLQPNERELVQQMIKRRERCPKMSISIIDPWATVSLLKEVSHADDETLVECSVARLRDIQKLREEVKLIVIEAVSEGQILQQQGFSLLRNYGLAEI